MVFSFRFWNAVHYVLTHWLRRLDNIGQYVRIGLNCPGIFPIIQEYLNIYPDHRYATLISLRERERRQMDRDISLTYGEVRWTTLIRIMKALDIQSSDIFVDLGCGAAWPCFYVHQKYNIPVVGVDVVQAFIQNGQTLAEKLQLSSMQFLEADFFTTELPLGTVYYITCTCFSPDYRTQLAALFRQSPVGTRIVTVTFPLAADFLQLNQSFYCLFSWGLDKVYIFEKL